jgi:two-component system sensor kinase FixL
MAVASVAIALGARLLFAPLIGYQFPFATLFFAVLVSAWFGGVRPALMAALLGGLSAMFFLLPRSGFAGIALLGGAMQSAREKSEGSAQASRRQGVIIDQAYDAIVVWELNGPITFWNSGAERLYGIPRAEAVAKPARVLPTISVALKPMTP